MLVSRLWLQKFFDTELPPAEKLSEALTFHAFEIEGIERHGSPQRGDEASDDILDVKITPNRGADSLSHRGIAKELSAILHLPLAHDPLEGGVELLPATDTVAVAVDTPLCRRYIAGYLKSVRVGPSPRWLKARLEAVGQRSINNVVDATNFVMLTMGQPLHAFDAKKLTLNNGQYTLRVRQAKSGGEALLALDDKEYSLTDSMVVITDGNTGAAVGIAGVKGGKPAGITEATTDIIIESANFDAVTTRKTAQEIRLRTDASTRFEQGLSPELSGYGMRSVVELIQKLAGGELQGYADVYPKPQELLHVSVSVEKVNHVLGTTVTKAEVADAFTRLGFGYTEEAGMFEVSVPFERLDLRIPEDLVEEVGRIVGYDAVPETPLPAFLGGATVNSNFYVAEKVREDLVGKGYSEVYTSVFVEAGERAVLNKVDSVRPYLRTTLIEGLTEALKKNLPHKDLLGKREVKLFEIGTVWRKGKEETMVGTVSENEPAGEKPLTEYVQSGKPMQYDALPASTNVQYRPFSKYPYIVRDVALWAGGTDVGEVQKIIEKGAGALCVNAYLFDRFEKAGKVSLAFRLIFQSFERTLTEAEANETMVKVHVVLRAKGFDIR